jgi:hypothetical protein
MSVRVRSSTKTLTKSVTDIESILEKKQDEINTVKNTLEENLSEMETKFSNIQTLINNNFSDLQSLVKNMNLLPMYLSSKIEDFTILTIYDAKSTPTLPYITSEGIMADISELFLIEPYIDANNKTGIINETFTGEQFHLDWFSYQHNINKEDVQLPYGMIGGSGVNKDSIEAKHILQCLNFSLRSEYNGIISYRCTDGCGIYINKMLVYLMPSSKGHNQSQYINLPSDTLITFLWYGSNENENSGYLMIPQGVDI